MNKQLDQQASRPTKKSFSHLISLAREETWVAVVFGIGFAGIAMHATLITIIIINS